MHAIAPYSIRFFDPNSTAIKIEDRYSKLDKVGAYDAFNILEDYFKRVDDKFVIAEDAKQVYRFKGMVADPAKRQVAGWFEVGSYGVKNDIIDGGCRN
ncbi:hypothetical protein [Pseudomonas sp. EL_65y_Pfl1_R83]|uniref:hypothetical protein n=1 Tax=Pseudomonas sp. EL_65y_Pfl1_R83 TaxID=3088697 RepID=UPI0030D906D2